MTTWTAPDGWPLRRFDWPHPAPRGRVLLQGGRGDTIEKYVETAGHLYRRGWSIASFDWRGQGGSGRLAADPHVGHAADFAPWIEDLAAFWRGWSAGGRGPRVILGHSMGGFLALAALVRGAIEADAAVLVAPMLGLRSPVGARLGGAIARVAARYAPTRAAWREGEAPGPTRRRSLLTHDAGRYEDEAWWHRQQPSLRLGPPSWGWLDRAFAETHALACDPRLDTLATPVLMLVADRDRLVDPRAAAAIAARLPRGEIVRFGADTAHEILREADPVRDRALEAIDGFLDQAAAA